MLKISFDLLERWSNSTKEVYFIYDLKARQLLFMNNFSRYFPEHPMEELRKDPSQVLALIHPEDKEYVIRNFKKVKKEEVAVIEEFRLWLPDKSIRWVNMKTYRIQNEENEHGDGQGEEQGIVFAIMEDITQRKEYALTLFNIKEQKDTVLQILGHDLRSPLNIIQMSNTLLRREKAVNEEKGIVKKLIETIDKTSKGALRMIADLLDSEYLETQEMKFTKTRINVVSRIQNTLDALTLNSTQKTIAFTTTKDEIYVSVDPIKFMLIIENLISNAYKFTAPDGTIKIDLRDQGETILISVADNGIGIPMKLQPMVFDKFTKARRKGVQGEKPVGLGMHIIKKMVEIHKGRIWFESQEGEGTVFFVEIPK